MRYFHTLLALLLCSPTWAVEQPGAFDLQGFIDKQLEAGETRIVIPPGKYRVTPRKRMHLRLENLEDIEIVANGVEMICTETTRAVTIDRCRNLTLRGLVIDYDPLPFTQGEITAISKDKLVHDIEIFSGYPTSGKITGKKYEIYNPKTRTLRYGSYHGCEVTQTAPGRLRLTKPARWKNKGAEKVGDIIAVDCLHAPGGSIPHALSITHSAQVTLDSVTIYSSAVFGFIESDCKSNVYKGCVVDRRSMLGDIKKRASARIRSLNADAFHSYTAEKGPQYLKCRARFQGDDCVAINGEYHMVMGSHEKTLRVLARRIFNMKKGDCVEIMTYEGKRPPDARVISIRPDEAITPEERGFLQKQKMDARFKASMRKAYLVTLDREVQLPMGSLICSSNRLGNGFKIIDGDFGFTRSRGFLLQAGKGEIRGNTLDGCHGEAIKVEPEFWWLAAGCTNNVVIRNNVIKNCRRTAIKVSAHGGSRKLSPAGAHRNMTIIDNRIENENARAPQISVTSTNGVTISRNKISQPLGTSPKSSKAIETKQCLNVTIKDNTITP